ncbi:DUF1302 family protein [Rheinheimera baltica]|uniref:DUF1302 family protein n=1 Tax=Rheinheimera baltica TaxID=67576 RepID=UPI00273F8849|nr:DUF1302 family protein [Rheinheimera baltica]MDP5151043.1 hypothetical protein [Rheinheimera baltica]
MLFKLTATALLRCYATSVLLACCMLHSAAANSDDFFADIDVNVDNLNQLPSPNKWFVRQLLSYGVEAPGQGFSRSEVGFNKIETSIHGEVSYTFSERISGRIEAEAFYDAIYRLDSDIQPSAQELSEFETRFQLRDAYLDISLTEQWHLRLGHQIIAWGQSDAVVIADVIAPHNNYTLLQADLRDVRLQVPAAHFTRSTSDFTLDMVLTYDAGFNQLAPLGNEFDPFIALRDLPQPLAQYNADNKIEYFVRLKHNFHGGDVSLIMAEANNNTLTLQQAKAEQLSFSQDRFSVLALTSSLSQGLWVYKAELGVHHNKSLMPAATKFNHYLGGWPQHDQLLSMAGFDYVGWRNTTLSLELNLQHTAGDTDALSIDKNEYGAMFSLLWSDTNEKLTVKANAISMLDNNGRIFRLNLEYPLTDAFKVGGLLVHYHFNQSDTLYPYRNNDVVQIYGQYDF